MHFHKAQEKPKLWGSFQDRQYSIWRNLEDIYGCDHESEVLIMPLFWGLPCLDYSKFGNHGTNHGATYKDGSLDFDGSNDYVQITNSASLNSPGYITVSMRIKPDYLYSNDWIVFHKGATEGWQILGSGSNTLRFLVDTGAVYNSTAISIISDIFTHITGVFDGVHVSLYADGQLSGTPAALAGTIDNINANMTLGMYAVYPYKGIIDEVRLSNTVRLAETIALFHDRPWALYERVGRPIWSLPSTDIDETLKLISLSLSISETDLQAYKDLQMLVSLLMSLSASDILNGCELNRQIDLNIAVQNTDAQSYLDNRLIDIVSTFQEADIQDYKDLEKQIDLTLSFIETDTQSYKDLNNLINITSLISLTDIQSFIENVIVNLNSSISVTDILYSMESRTVSILCTVSELDFFPGLESDTRKSFVLTGRINEYVLTDRIRDYVLMSRIKEYELMGRNKNYYLS